MIRQKAPGAIQPRRRWVDRIPRDGVEHEVHVEQRRLVKVRHLLDVPRLRKSQRDGGRPGWKARRQRPAGPRFAQTMERNGGWVRKHGDVPRRRQTIKSIYAAENGLAGSVVKVDDIADVQQQRAACGSGGPAVDVRSELLEPFARGGSKLFPPAVQLGRQAAQEGLIAVGYRRTGAWRAITGVSGNRHERSIRQNRPIPTSPGTREVVQDRPRQTREAQVQRSELGNDFWRKQKARLEQFRAHLDLRNVGEYPSGDPGSGRQTAARGSPETTSIRATDPCGGAAEHRVAFKSLTHRKDGFVGRFHGAAEEQQ